MDYRNSSRDEGSSRDSSLGPSEPENTVEEPRRKNLDRRRETSRYAARDRRGKEADIFVDLKDVVPVVEETTVTHVDRIALLRVASTMCRMRRNAARFLETELPPEDPEVNVFTEQTLTECMDGFVLLADSDGTILYVSESVSVFLGLTQTDLVGRFLNEFVHAQDYDELIRLSTTDCDGDEASTLDDFGRYLVVRMKTVISPRGRNLNLKSALYKAILCRFRAVTTEYGRLSLFYGSSTPAGQGNSVMLANASVKGSETTNGVYMTRHTCDMRFSYVSDSLNFLLRHEARSLMGSSFYDLVHPSDVHTVAQSMRELFKKGHCRTAFYRLLGANSSVAWVQTEATTVNHTARGQKGQYVLCVHSILGMQSEAESWSDPVIDEQLAANPAYCTSQIKREIPDMAEYMGRQPEFIECVDFTPLIDPIADVNFAEFNSANSSINQRSSAKARNDQQVPQSKRKRFSFSIESDGDEPEDRDRSSLPNKIDNSVEINVDEQRHRKYSTSSASDESTNGVISKTIPSNENHMSSDSSSSGDADLLIYIPKFESKRSKRTSRNFVMRKLRKRQRKGFARCLEALDQMNLDGSSEVSAVSATCHCGVVRRSEVVQKCRQRRRNNENPSNISDRPLAKRKRVDSSLADAPQNDCDNESRTLSCPSKLIRSGVDNRSEKQCEQEAEIEWIPLTNLHARPTISTSFYRRLLTKVLCCPSYKQTLNSVLIFVLISFAYLSMFKCVKPTYLFEMIQ